MDEWTVYSITPLESESEFTTDIPEDKIKWINTTMREAERVQDYLLELRDLFEQA